MKNNIWKVQVIKDAENLFEELCKEQNIKYTKYPKPFEGIYKAECKKEKLLDIGYCIFTLEEMPKVSLS